MTETEFTLVFRQRGLEDSLWQHPYFKKIEEVCTRDDLKRWALQAGRIDEIFADVLQNMILNPAIPACDHEPLKENLADERGNGDRTKEHFTLFLGVLNALGISEEEYERTGLTRGTQRIVDTLKEASQDTINPLRILSLMASEELICPHEFPLLLNKLRNYLAEDKLEYFKVHIEADIGHANDLIHLCYTTAQRTHQAVAAILEWQQEDLANNRLFYDDLMV